MNPRKRISGEGEGPGLLEGVVSVLLEEDWEGGF